MASAAGPGPAQTWNRDEVVSTYARRHYVTPAEVRVIAESWSRIVGGTVLDVGVGTGRTVPYLAPAAASYTAVDLMPNMVAEARLQHPGRDIRQADVLALPFASGTFSFLLFSFCGIDYVDPVDRPGVLAEAHRVLAPGGIFAFSTHNLAARSSSSRFEPDLPRLGRNPLRAGIRAARGIVSMLRSYRNYLRLQSLERPGRELAYVNDGAHEYALLTCYVTERHQREALDAAGFDVSCVIAPDGTGASPASRARDLYFVAVKR